MYPLYGKRQLWRKRAYSAFGMRMYTGFFAGLMRAMILRRCSSCIEVQPAVAELPLLRQMWKKMAAPPPTTTPPLRSCVLWQMSILML